MNSRPELKLDWCSHKAAKYAVEHWHYSGSLPSGKLVKIGVWEGGIFIGSVLFGLGANNRLSSRFSLKRTEVCELVRVALNRHEAPVSKIVAIALKKLYKFCPGLSLVVSYADPEQGHYGGIYQAMNWLYVGQSVPQRELRVAGRFLHKRSASALYGTASPKKISAATGLDVSYGPIYWKYTYCMPLNKGIRKQVEPLAKPYPKHAPEA